MALANTSVLLADGGKTTRLTVLVDRVTDPVHARVSADSLVLGVDQDDLVVLVSRVLVHPVGVQDAQVGAATANTLFSSCTQRSLVLELVDTLGSGLTIDLALGNGSLTTTTTDADSVDHVSLLGLVAQTASLVGSRGAGSAVDNIELSVMRLKGLW